MAISQEVFAYWRKHGAPGFKPDEAEAFQSHADGKMYTSKAAYRNELKARGFEEKGDCRNTAPDKPKDDIIADIKHTMGDL